MKFLFSIVFLFVSLVSMQLHATAFTADAVQIRGENISHAKMYWLDGNVRFEYTEDGVSMVQIFDNKNNKTIWLDNENKYYLEREISEAEKVISVAKGKKNSDPCKQFVGAECVFLKKAKINGRGAAKWLITLDNNGNDFHIIQWVDSKYKNILRQENSDGTGLSVEIIENLEMNNRKVRKLTMTAFSSSGEQKQGTQWYDSELDIVVKQEYQDNVVDELRNIKLGKVSKTLFVAPKDYSLFNEPLDKEKHQVGATPVKVADKN
jgi:hypothetical protein